MSYSKLIYTVHVLRPSPVSSSLAELDSTLHHHQQSVTWGSSFGRMEFQERNTAPQICSTKATSPLAAQLLTHTLSGLILLVICFFNKQHEEFQMIKF